MELIKIKNKVIALAGNPNVGKSTVFNALTGMNQHTGNWPGKTVSNAKGKFSTKKGNYIIYDLPGTYSLLAHSAEEEIARNFICFEKPDCVIAVCDATCLGRNLIFVLQIMEICPNVIVCINLLDEAKRKDIKIDLNLLSKKLGTPVIGIVARKRKSIKALTDCIDNLNLNNKLLNIKYHKDIEDAISIIEPTLSDIDISSKKWLSLKLLENDLSLLNECNTHYSFTDDTYSKLEEAKNLLTEKNITTDKFKDMIVSAIVLKAEKIYSSVVTKTKDTYNDTDRKFDKILTGKFTGFPAMFLFVALIFWITIYGANYPSAFLSNLLFSFEEPLFNFFNFLSFPLWLNEMLVFGVYRVTSWVISVMLPPMAIFFPLFTLFEDLGYLPRIAFNLDKPFKKCNACGKQSLTMCMGMGCNAVGVTGCRIIDSERERLLAILTNNFMPCNGRFPAIISIITIFFCSKGLLSSLSSSLFLTFVIILGVIVTFAITKVLSVTLLKGVPSSYTLELPPYRRPQIGKIIVRSLLDRTIFVLSRAIMVAAPAGLVIWLMANLQIGDVSLLRHCSSFLNPIARIMGLDGEILMAFILGFPANETVMPIILMSYLSQGTLTEFTSIETIKTLLVSNGWNIVTAINFILFSLMHWPCSTTLLTIKKETRSLKWTLLSFIIPTLTGFLCCTLVNLISKLFI